MARAQSVPLQGRAGWGWGGSVAGSKQAACGLIYLVWDSSAPQATGWAAGTGGAGTGTTHLA